jgi:hypothetical protein
MAGPKLDGAGMAKMAVLEEALQVMASVHAAVEKLAVAMKSGQNSQLFIQQIKRQLTPLSTKLKVQFGMIADQVAAMLLASTRGASEQVRLRMLREHVAQIRTALELAQGQVLVKHAVKEGSSSAPDGSA